MKRIRCFANTIKSRFTFIMPRLWRALCADLQINSATARMPISGRPSVCCTTLISRCIPSSIAPNASR